MQVCSDSRWDPDMMWLKGCYIAMRRDMCCCGGTLCLP